MKVSKKRITAPCTSNLTLLDTCTYRRVWPESLAHAAPVNNSSISKPLLRLETFFNICGGEIVTCRSWHHDSLFSYTSASRLPLATSCHFTIRFGLRERFPWEPAARELPAGGPVITRRRSSSARHGRCRLDQCAPLALPGFAVRLTRCGRGKIPVRDGRLVEHLMAYSRARPAMSRLPVIGTAAQRIDVTQFALKFKPLRGSQTRVTSLISLHSSTSQFSDVWIEERPWFQRR